MWYQILISVFVGMIGMLGAVLLGGWLVFKTKTITMPTTFMELPRRKVDSGKPDSYMPEDLRTDTSLLFDDELSAGAARLRAQGGAGLNDKEAILSLVGKS